VIYVGGTAVGLAGRVISGDGGEAGMIEFTLSDVKMRDAEFEMEGPFDLRVQDQLFGPCSVENYRRLRPGYTYDRVVLRGEFKKQMRSVPAADEDSKATAKGNREAGSAE